MSKVTESTVRPDWWDTTLDWDEPYPKKGELRKARLEIDGSAHPDIRGTPHGPWINKNELFIIVGGGVLPRQYFKVLTSRGIFECHVFYIARDSELLESFELKKHGL